MRPRDRRERSDHVHGIGEILDRLLGEGALARGLPLGRLAGSWADVVGETLARETAPVRLERGVLDLTVTTSAWGAQVRFLAPDIARKANEVLGAEAVREVRVQVGPEGASRAQKRTSKPHF